jgi:hypothetical protein
MAGEIAGTVTALLRRFLTFIIGEKNGTRHRFILTVFSLTLHAHMGNTVNTDAHRMGPGEE